MPQLDLSTFPTQLFWLAVTFFVLYVLMSKIALPRIGDILEERQKRISDDLDQADRLKGDTETAIAAYEAAMAEARTQAQEEIAKVMAANAAEAAARAKAVDELLSAKIADSEAKIRTAHAEALVQVSGIATEVSEAIVDRLAGMQAGAEALAQAVSTVAKERGL